MSDICHRVQQLVKTNKTLPTAHWFRLVDLLAMHTQSHNSRTFRKEEHGLRSGSCFLTCLAPSRTSGRKIVVNPSQGNTFRCTERLVMREKRFSTKTFRSAIRPAAMLMKRDDHMLLGDVLSRSYRRKSRWGWGSRINRAFHRNDSCIKKVSLFRRERAEHEQLGLLVASFGVWLWDGDDSMVHCSHVQIMKDARDSDPIKSYQKLCHWKAFARFKLNQFAFIECLGMLNVA